MTSDALPLEGALAAGLVECDTASTFPGGSLPASPAWSPRISPRESLAASRAERMLHMRAAMRLSLVKEAVPRVGKHCGRALRGKSLPLGRGLGKADPDSEASTCESWACKEHRHAPAGDDRCLLTPSARVQVVDKQRKGYQATILVVNSENRTYKVRANDDGHVKVIKAKAVQQVLSCWDSS
mmetsp:Transcript_84008/g.195399  ORF Transcript_84008/g.195399 Transcript_84008/m.195399 type:complete len:183 (+) Transcript_84008:80-628(+)|eukprot:CAMPEP_0171069630 /NCGR_PEP_ID=MMETSP0766_2-20121228/9264_1 /TAXON_ID=439317 /ORGANISM="Gambierdiscus australes, Strain CAWD 149" /LENGTH=182 /DNA_ID=CAMNT_0011526029 /DNA_START=77 /DNA_END=625 /DNA_ORIENTATION=+